MRFPFFWAPQQRTDLTTDAASPPPINIFEFTAHRAVLAIAFHLVDQGIATHVCPRSREVMTQRLAPGGDPNRVLLRVASTHWRRMTDRERLQWLLDRTHLRVDVSDRDGVARLALA
jgi:hypothetical protein